VASTDDRWHHGVMRRCALPLLIVSAACGSFQSSATDAGTSQAADAGANGGDGGGGLDGGPGGLTGDAALSPDGAVPPDHIRTMFVTAAFFDGAIGGIAGADLACTKEAATSTHPAVMGRTFRAWLSAPNQDVGARLHHGTLSYVTPAGGGTTMVIAERWDLLRLQLQRPLERDQHGEKVNSIFFAWTGSSEKGASVEPSCDHWTNNQTLLTGTVGAMFVVDKGWSNYSSPKACSEAARLICMEE
jgi:hypothetical protein